MCAFFTRAQGCGCGQAPGIPCALCCQGGIVLQNPDTICVAGRRKRARNMSGSSVHRERFWIASSLSLLAMTWDTDLPVVSSPRAKNISLLHSVETALERRLSRARKRGVSPSSRTLGAGCGGCRSFKRRVRLLHTAKPGGPDAPTLASSWRRCLSIVACDGGKQARSPGRARHKP